MSDSLKDIQQKFQAAILNQDDSILAAIKENNKEEKHTLLNVYQHAYGARLIEFLENDFPHTAAYLGQEAFAQTCQAYYETNPSNTPNARWFGLKYANFLKNYTPLQQSVEAAELATLEQALNTAFDAKNAMALTQADLANLTPQDWPTLTFTPHPSTCRLQMRTNADLIWAALSKEKTPPDPQKLQMPTELIVWRGQGMARFRTLSYDEAMIWDEAVKGTNFGALCEMLGTYWPQEEAPLKAANYLQAWLSSEFLEHNPTGV